VAASVPSTQAVYNIVGYAEALGKKRVAPHELRRTFAKLVYRGGAAIDQIQLSLGHKSIQTAEDYLGVEQGLIDPPCDDRINAHGRLKTCNTLPRFMTHKGGYVS
jgi:integrase